MFFCSDGVRYGYSFDEMLLSIDKSPESMVCLLLSPPKEIFVILEYLPPEGKGICKYDRVFSSFFFLVIKHTPYLPKFADFSAIHALNVSKWVL